MPDKRKFPGRGFTLVELLVVATAVAVTSMIALSVFFTAQERARQAATIADMRSLAVVIEAYKMDFESIPTLAGDFSDVFRLLEPYNTTDVAGNDHWAHLYDYHSTCVQYTLTSFGKDGVDGPDLTLNTRNDYDRDIVLVNGEFRSWPGEDHQAIDRQPENDAPPGQDP